MASGPIATKVQYFECSALHATRYTGCNIHTRQTPNLLVQVIIVESQSKMG